jgi:hypothetical protein
VTGLTPNRTIFDHAITKSQAYDAAIRKKMQEGEAEEPKLGHDSSTNALIRRYRQGKGMSSHDRSDDA